MVTSGATLHAFSDGCCREGCCDVAWIGGATTQRRTALVRLLVWLLVWQHARPMCS